MKNSLFINLKKNMFYHSVIDTFFFYKIILYIYLQA